MNCREASDLIQDYVDGRVDGARRKRLTQHTAECDHCAQELIWYQALVADIEGMERAEVPAGFADGIIRELRARRRIVRLRIVDARGWLATLPSRLGGALAVVAILVAAFVVFPSFVGFVGDVVGKAVLLVTETYIEVQDQLARVAVADRFIDSLAANLRTLKTVIMAGFSLLSTLGGVLLLPALGLVALVAVGLGWYYRAQKRGAHHATFSF